MGLCACSGPSDLSLYTFESAILIKEELAMSKNAVALALVLGIGLPLSATADDTLARFKGGIGVHPVSNISGTANADGSFPNVTRNIVRGVNPAGQVWVIDKLEAKVEANGHISVKGKGLVLAGGNSAGRATGQFVVATL